MEESAMVSRLIVFAGPPLSGKSTLSKEIALWYPDSVRFEMDEFRLKKLPDSEHNKADRNIAYRMVHANAEAELRSKRSCVILVATYAPSKHRQAVVELAKESSVGIYLVECRVSPEDAVSRLRERSRRHAGIDLTSTRVREIASDFPTYGGGCVVDTTKDNVQTCLALIRNYLDKGSPLWSPEDWARASQTDQENHVSPLQTPVAAKAEPKLSPVSRREARLRILAYGTIFLLAAFVYGYGLVELYFAYVSQSDSLFIQATAYLTAGFFIFAVPPVYNFLEKPLNESRRILQFGKTPRYNNVKEVHRSNRELCRDYLERMTKAKASQGFLIDGIPVYFLIRPKTGESFDAVCDPSGEGSEAELERFQSNLRDEAAKWGFDWNGYRKWRIGEKASEYFGGKTWTRALRAVGVTHPADNVVRVNGAFTRYADYLVIEQSVNLEASGQFPYMREFFEGNDWWSKEVDLDSVEIASQRYSMMVSVAASIITKDDFVVFQRRSAQVQSGQGGLTASVSGGVEWEDVNGSVLAWEGLMPRRRRASSRFSLRNALFREIREELGLFERDFEEDHKPFVAAAFNLRYGRDLNFYACLKSKLTRGEISEIFNDGRKLGFFRSAGRDRWEVAHLVFMPLEWLRLDDPGSVARREEVLGDARHAHGIVKALRVFKGWESS